MATQLATVETKVDPLRQAIEQMAPEFKMALPAHVTPEKFIRVAMTAINSNPELRQADRRSLFSAVTKLAQDGLLADGREAALVIFNSKNRQTNEWEKRVQAMPMIAGLLKLMRQSGEVAWVDAHIVCENDRFVYRPGLDDVPVFEPDWFGDRGQPIGAYAIAKLKSGEIVPPEIMSVAAIEKVRAVSRSKDKGPWVDWWEQQALKTVLRRFLKRLPTSADVERAFDRDETMQAQFDGEPALAVEHEPVRRLTRLEAIEESITAEPPVEPEVITEQAEEIEAEIAGPDNEGETEREPDPRTNDLLVDKSQQNSAPVAEVAAQPTDLLDEVAANPQKPGDDPAAAKCNAIIGELTKAGSVAEITRIWGQNAVHFDALGDLMATLTTVKKARLAEIKAGKVEA